VDIFNQYNLIYFKGTRRFNVNNNGGGYSQNYYENQVNNNGNGYQQSYREHKREAEELLNSNSILIIYSKNFLPFLLSKQGPNIFFINTNFVRFLGSLTLLYFHFVARSFAPSQIFLLKTPPTHFFLCLSVCHILNIAYLA
jgi:hypothetical protein